MDGKSGRKRRTFPEREVLEQEWDATFRNFPEVGEPSAEGLRVIAVTGQV